MELTGLGFQADGIKMNKYLYNGGSLLIDELNLDMYWTPNRLYDPTIGRFQGMDKLSDMFTSVSPMIYGFNNPLKFKDPTGLSGDCDGCVDLPTVVVSGTRLPETAPNYSALLNQLTKRSKPVYRNLGLTAQHNGLGQANQLLNRGNSLHFSSGEALRSRNSGYLDGIGAMVSYGITGSILAVAASPMLIETLIPALMNKTALDMSMEAGWQMGNSLLFNGNLSQMDLADILFAGVGGKYAYVFQAMVDFDADGLSVAGANKNLLNVGVDLGIGRFNSWHSNEMKTAGVDQAIVNFFNYVNQPLRITFGTGIKTVVNDE